MGDTIQAEPKRQQLRSASQLTSYSQCGEAYRLERIARAPRRPAAWFFHGTAVHHTIERYEESRRKLTTPQLEDIFVDEYRRLAKEEIDKHDGNLDVFMTGGMKKPQTDMEDRERQGIYQVADYVKLAEAEADEWAIVASEIHFEVDIGGIPFQGFIDQVVLNRQTNLVYPRDIKTGANMPPTPVQLVIYVRGLMEYTRKAEAEGRELPWRLDQIINYAEWLKCGRPPSKTGKTAAKPTEIIPMDLANWGDARLTAWVAEFDRAERAGIYLPSPSSDCLRTCPVSQYCAFMGHPESAAQYARKDLPETPSTKENK